MSEQLQLPLATRHDNYTLLDELRDDSIRLLGHCPPRTAREALQVIADRSAMASTPSLLSALTTLLELGLEPEPAMRAHGLLNAADWLATPWPAVTDEEVAALRAARLWELPRKEWPTRGQAVRRALGLPLRPGPHAP